MRKARLVGSGTSYYHVMSRVVERRFYFGEEEKERFRSMMWRVAEFSGVHILTYVVMDNHFHLLIEVPTRKEVPDDELFRRLSLIYPKDEVDEVRTELENSLKEGIEKVAERIRTRYLYRMYDLSEFMKTLKLRFSKWFNRLHDRRGPLWEERFKSILIEGPSFVSGGYRNRNPLHTIAAYIDLNAVRAGIIDDPADYRWCGYAEAIAGERFARDGLGVVLGMPSMKRGDWDAVAKIYRLSLFMGSEKPFSREQVMEVVASGGALSAGALLYCRVRYFSDGMVIGSRVFVEDVFVQKRHLFGEKRKTGARKMQGGDWCGLCSMRDLKDRAVERPI